jgi:hypothetical protein
VTALLVVTVAMLAFIVFMQAGRIHHLTRRIDQERTRARALHDWHWEPGQCPADCEFCT